MEGELRMKVGRQRAAWVRCVGGSVPGSTPLQQLQPTPPLPGPPGAPTARQQHRRGRRNGRSQRRTDLEGLSLAFVPDDLLVLEPS